MAGWVGSRRCGRQLGDRLMGASGAGCQDFPIIHPPTLLPSSCWQGAGEWLPLDCPIILLPSHLPSIGTAGRELEKAPTAEAAGQVAAAFISQQQA